MGNILNTEIHLRVIELSYKYSRKRGESKGISVGDAAKLLALDSVNLDVKCGEFIGVLGPNGCGKSTLLKILNSTIRPDKGEILIADDNDGSIQNGTPNYMSICEGFEAHKHFSLLAQ